MRCPYCTSEIADEALACPHCTRDLYLFKPLLERIARLEAQVAQTTTDTALHARIADLEARLEQAEPARAPAAPASGGARLRLLAVALLGTVLLALLAHWLMLFVYDARPLLLRIATLAIPVPFGFLLGMRRVVDWRGALACAALTATLAVLAMLSLTAWIDRVPVLPEGARDVRETVEYVAGIGLAFVTGHLLGSLLAGGPAGGRPPLRAAVLLSRVLVPGESGEAGIQSASEAIDRLIKMATTVATAGAALYSGVRSLLDVIQ